MTYNKKLFEYCNFLKVILHRVNKFTIQNVSISNDIILNKKK